MTTEVAAIEWIRDCGKQGQGYRVCTGAGRLRGSTCLARGGSAGSTRTRSQFGGRMMMMMIALTKIPHKLS